MSSLPVYCPQTILSTSIIETSVSIINSQHHNPPVAISHVPPLLLFNHTGLYQPNALEILHADIIAHSISVIIIVETWFKHNHITEITDIAGYTCYRKDRQKRIWGGVTCYVRIGTNSERYNPPPGDDCFENFWITIDHITANYSNPIIVAVGSLTSCSMNLSAI